MKWPSSNVQELTDVAPDQSLTVTEQVLITPVRPSSSLGGSVTLTAQRPGTWQWYHDGVALDGQTAKTLTLSNIQATDAGSFVADRFWGNPIWGDFNRDGRIDLAVANAWDKPPSEPDWSRNLLYFNVGDGTFRKETQGNFAGDNAGFSIEGGAAGDMDGDGDLDILLTGGSGRLAWFENDGAGGFRRVTVILPPMSGTLITPSWADCGER